MAGIDLDFITEVKRGNVPGWSGNIKFGRRNVVDDTSDDDIWEGTADQYTGWLTAASAVRIKAGGNAADDAGGAGAQSITIEGLDENGDEASESLATAGALVSSATTTTFIRVFRCYIADAGVGTYHGANTGDVFIETTGGVEVAVILAGTGQTQMCMFTVPLGMRCHFLGAHVYNESGKKLTAKVWSVNDILDVTTPFSPKRLRHQYDGKDAAIGRELVVPHVFDALTDVWVSATYEAGKTGAVSAEMDYLLETV